MPEQALAQLHDIHLPQAVSAWPPAPGWWLLFVVFWVAVAVAIYGYQRYRGGKAQREALAMLDFLYARFLGNPDTGAFCSALSTLLRRYALCLYPRKQVAGLAGAQWLRFLDKTGGEGQFSRGPGRVLTEAPYRRDAMGVDAEALLNLSKRWIKKAKP